jgi:hypothetical protein
LVEVVEGEEKQKSKKREESKSTAIGLTS